MFPTAADAEVQAKHARWLAMRRCLRVAFIVLLLLLMAMPVYHASRNGTFRWGAFEENGAIPYLLVLGLLCSLITILIRGINQAEGALCFMIFLGYILALSGLKPDSFSTPRDLTWFHSFVGIITAGTVITAGSAVSKRRRNSTSESE